MIPSASIEDILGGPEVTHVFVHELAALPEDVGFLKREPDASSRDERALLIAGRQDVVCVSSSVDPDYLQFLGDLGVGPGTGRVLQVPIPALSDRATPLSLRLARSPTCLGSLGKMLQGRDRVIVNPYAATGADFDLADKLASLLGRSVAVQGGNCRIADQVNNKWHTYVMARRMGVPVLAAELVKLKQAAGGGLPDDAPLRKAVARFFGRTGKAIIRGIRGTSGSTNLVADPASPGLEWGLRRLVANETTRSYLVQTLFDILVSPNVQLYIDPCAGKISMVASTDQLLDDFLVHRGNLYPSLAEKIPEMLQSALRMAEGLSREGYGGFLGFDFVEYMDPEKGQRSYFLAEINGRVNGATYPCLLTQRLSAAQRRQGSPVPAAFCSTHISTGARSFREFTDRYGHLFFKPGSGCGLFPFHTGALPYGKCGAVFFGRTRHEVEALYKAVVQGGLDTGRAAGG